MSVIYPEIIKETEYPEKISYINHVLEEKVITKKIAVNSNVLLHLEEYLSPNAKGNVVILHGFSEFCQKYRETIWYFYNLGFNVFIYDQRDHGFSYRYAPDSQLLNVEKFENYVSDLEFIINNEITDVAPNLDLYIFSHSMGGAVATYYCINHPEKVKKLVLSSPLVTLKTNNIPQFAVKLLARFTAKRKGSFSAFPFQSGFNKNVKLEDSSDMSKARFLENLKLRINNPALQPSIATNNWMLESAKVKKHLFKKGNLSKIKTETVMFIAENEQTIKKGMQIKFANKLPNCKLFETANTKHNIFSSGDETLEFYYKTIFDFFCTND